jgi:hypothetical protein
MLTRMSLETLAAPETKLAELRARTDRDLTALFRKELQRGLQLAAQCDCAAAELAHARAERLLSLLRGFQPADLRSFEGGLAELRARIEETALSCAGLAS